MAQRVLIGDLDNTSWHQRVYEEQNQVSDKLWHTVATAVGLVVCCRRTHTVPSGARAAISAICQDGRRQRPPEAFGRGAPHACAGGTACGRAIR